MSAQFYCVCFFGLLSEMYINFQFSAENKCPLIITYKWLDMY